MRYKKKARKGVLRAVERKLVTLLHIVVLMGLIIWAMVAGHFKTKSPTRGNFSRPSGVYLASRARNLGLEFE